MLWMALPTAALAGPLGPTHTFGLRYRHGWLPRGILDAYYYDSDDEGALPYERPGVTANVYGFEYTLGVSDTASFQFWLERVAVPLEGGYWDDKETAGEPPDHQDGDWIEAYHFGAVVIGASYAYDIRVFEPAKVPAVFSIAVGGGFGVGPRTGSAVRWHPGYNPEVVDKTCLPDSFAYDRYLVCPDDGAIAIPSVIPIIDLTVSPKVTIAEHAVVRFDFGLHTFPYVGFAAGGTL